MTGGVADSDVVRLARDLIACRSVTPDDGGCLRLVVDTLGRAGFSSERLDAGGVSNLWSVWGSSGRLLVFAGHVDVVPPGDSARWESDPFTPTVRDGRLHGRGACDMKGAVAAMVCAAASAAASGRIREGRIGVLLTSDEEGDAVHGTDHVVRELCARGVTIDHCLVGEPTSSARLGDTAKNGRRGSLTLALEVPGVQGHSAYPEHADNAAHRAVELLSRLIGADWNPVPPAEGFPPNGLQVTDLRSGLGVTNVIPGSARALVNIRYAPPETAAGLSARAEALLGPDLARCRHEWIHGAEPYVCGADTRLARELKAAIGELLGVQAGFSCGGGASDGRFLARISRELAEFGPVGASMHKENEHVGVGELEDLRRVYERLAHKLLE